MMISTRYIRVIVSVLAIFGIVAFFSTSQTSFKNTVQKVQPASSGDHIPFTDPTEGSKNTLQGTSHQGTSPPYAQEGKTSSGAAKTKPKVVADKTNAESNKDTPAKAPDVVSNAPIKDITSTGAKCDKKDYVIMVDAGSTGSRIHVYEFDTCYSPPRLLQEHFEMKNPGLSSFDTDTKGAAASLDSLLQVALDKIPKDKQGCTPIAVKATAGLRLLGKEKSDNILAEVRKHLETDFPFAVVAGDGISIMDGRDEGVYAWITTNYLLGNIGSAEKTPTAAVFDLGGGSTQIVFEPEFGNNEKMVEGEHKYAFTFGNRDFTLYQFSHLGFGLMEGRNKVNSLVVDSYAKANPDFSKSKLTKAETKEAKGVVTINNPCIPPGVVAKDIKVQVGKDEFYVVNFKGASSETTATGASCRFLAEKVLNKEAECSEKPCSFNGIHQPSLTKAFKKSSDMYVFSYFYDRTFPLGFPTSFTVEELTELAKVVCNGNQLWKDVLFDDHIKLLNEEPQWCLDLSFITALLHTGYDIPLHRELRTAKTIDNNELGWCLGASLPLLDGASSGWTCRVAKVE